MCCKALSNAFILLKNIYDLIFVSYLTYDAKLHFTIVDKIWPVRFDWHN